MHGLDSEFQHLTQDEEIAFYDALQNVINEAKANRHKRPKVTTIIEEFSEMFLSFRGKHEHSTQLELIQLSSVCINVLWQLEMGIDVNNVVTYKIS